MGRLRRREPKHEPYIPPDAIDERMQEALDANQAVIFKGVSLEAIDPDEYMVCDGGEDGYVDLRLRVHIAGPGIVFFNGCHFFRD